MRLSYYFSILCICYLLSCKGQESDISTGDTTVIRFISDTELQTKSVEELRLIRNEVFARKGYVFKNKDLTNHFKTKSWYKPDNNIDVKLSEEEEKYISLIKDIENKFSINKNTNCLYYFGSHNEGFFPLTNDNLLDNGNKYNTSLEKIKLEDLNPIIEGNLCGGGSVWDIMCYEDIKYQLLFYTCDNDNLYMSMAIIEKGEVKEFKQLYGSSLGKDGDSLVDGYHDANFKIDHDNLEVYKTYYIFDPEGDSPFAKKVVRKEVTKYKLTDSGLIEL